MALFTSPGSFCRSRIPAPVRLTSRRTPCFSIPATMFSVPLVCTSSGDVFVCPDALKTACVPATASSTFAASSASPRATASRSCLVRRFDGSCTMALTSCILVSACSTSERPVLPEAPKTATRTPHHPAVVPRALALRPKFC